MKGWHAFSPVRGLFRVLSARTSPGSDARAEDACEDRYDPVAGISNGVIAGAGLWLLLLLLVAA